MPLNVPIAAWADKKFKNLSELDKIGERAAAGCMGENYRHSVTDYVNQPWRFKRVRRIQDAGREDSDTLDTFDATDLRNIDPGKQTRIPLTTSPNYSAMPASWPGTHPNGCPGTTSTRSSASAPSSIPDRSVLLRYGAPAWPKTIRSGHRQEPIDNAHKTRLSQSRLRRVLAMGLERRKHRVVLACTPCLIIWSINAAFAESRHCGAKRREFRIRCGCYYRGQFGHKQRTSGIR